MPKSQSMKTLGKNTKIICKMSAQTIITDRPDQTESSSVIQSGGLQIESGLILGSAPTHMRSSSGMFLCPGFQRDFYVASIEGVVTRVFLP